MSKKKPSSVPETTNRPVVLGFLILAAGGYSTWYWYKPLPDLTRQVESSPWDADRASEWNWTDSAVLQPTFEELQASAVESTSLHTSVFELPRTDSGLLAAPNIKWQLKPLTQIEPPPKSPDIAIPDQAIVGQVKPWIDYDNLAEPAPTIDTYAWPVKPHRSEIPSTSIAQEPSTTRAILSSGPVDYPQASIGLGPPQLLDSSSNRIQVSDDDSPPPLPRSKAPTEFTAAPPRNPQYIRQPKSN
jgi:hypothetical protein